MFVSAACDLGSDDSRMQMHQLLLQYGFKAVQKNLYETSTLTEKNLARLKLEVDKITDSYDVLRFYQYPVEGTLVITALDRKRWRRLVVKT